MPGTVLAINSNWDQATAIATSYSEIFVLPQLAAAGFSIVELQGLHANPIEASAAAASPSVTYIIGVSHGTPDVFTGAGDCPVFSASALNPSIFHGKVVHFIACNTALILGPSLVSPAVGGASAFFGYRGLFTWPAGENNYAKMFFGCDSEIDRVLASHGTAGQALASAVAKFTRLIDWLIQQGDPISQRTACALKCNLDFLCGPTGSNQFGDPNARIW